MFPPSKSARTHLLRDWSYYALVSRPRSHSRSARAWSGEVAVAGVRSQGSGLDVSMSDFWVNFWSNLLSDLIVGAGIGFFLARWLNKLQQKDTDKAEEERKAKESRMRKEKILRLLKKELETNDTYINQSIPISSRDSMKDFDTINFLSLGLSNEHWKAFSDGGELQWINDVETLSKLATAYHSIQMVKLSSSAIIRYFFVEQRTSG